MNIPTRPLLRQSVFLLCVLSVGNSYAWELARRDGVLGKGESWETPYRIVESGEPGPTVLITGGVHGNEPAGNRAALQIQDWSIIRGRLLVLPSVNRLGLNASTRWSPDFRNDKSRRDPNRNYPRKDSSATSTPLSRAMWSFVERHRPTLVLDLHEGFDLHRLNPKSVGSSIITFPQNRDMAKAMLASVATTTDEARRFALLAKSGPARGSLARACGEQLGAQSFILETTSKSQPLSLRTRQHRLMVSTALVRMGMLQEDSSDLLATSTHSFRVAVFDAAGANPDKVIRAIRNHGPSVAVRRVGPHDLSPKVLPQFDALIFPGGSGSKQGKAIGETRREVVRQYVRDGGGVIGVCAGAYLCSSHYSWSLNLMNSAVYNKMVDIPGKGRRSMWYRGPAANVEVEVTELGGDVLGIRGDHSIRYQNGPILSVGDDPHLPAYEPLAFFRSENGLYEAQKGTMAGAPAVVSSEYGEGRVLAISPHFESTAGKEHVLMKALEFVRRQTTPIESLSP